MGKEEHTLHYVCIWKGEGNIVEDQPRISAGDEGKDAGGWRRRFKRKTAKQSSLGEGRKTMHSWGR